MPFAELFLEESIVCGLTSVDREGCVKELLGALVASGQLNDSQSEKAFEAIQKRERIGSTGIGKGVAIPHVKLEGVDRLVASVGTHRRGLDFQSIDGDPVKIIFLVVRPAADAADHLRFLQWISRLGRHDDVRKFLEQANSRREMLDVLHEMASL